MKSKVLIGMMAVCAVIVVVLVGSSIWSDIQRVQKFRTKFATDCANDYGYVLKMGRGSNKDYVCVGPDGRILRSY